MNKYTIVVYVTECGPLYYHVNGTTVARAKKAVAHLVANDISINFDEIKDKMDIIYVFPGHLKDLQEEK